MEGRRVHLGRAEVGEDLRLLSAVPDHLLLLESDGSMKVRPWDTACALRRRPARFGLDQGAHF